MKEITLLFPTLPQLWEFKTMLSKKTHEVVSSNLALSGIFTQKQIALALTSFQAIET
jgi:hypothetical protein